jgi:hypothetical protein
VTGVAITSDDISGGTLEKLKGSPAVALSAAISPDTITDQSVIWSSSDEAIASVSSEGSYLQWRRHGDDQRQIAHRPKQTSPLAGQRHQRFRRRGFAQKRT